MSYKDLFYKINQENIYDRNFAVSQKNNNNNDFASPKSYQKKSQYKTNKDKEKNENNFNKTADSWFQFEKQINDNKFKKMPKQSKIILLKSIEMYFPLRDFKIFMQKLVNYVEKNKQMIIYETNNIDVLTDICNSITIFDGEKVIFSGDDFRRLPIKTNLMKFADLANERNARLDYYKDINDMLKAIYRSVSDENK